MSDVAIAGQKVDAFDNWGINMVEQGDLTPKSVQKYRALWKAWREWLVLREQPWQKVTAALIEAFLLGPAPGQGGRRQAINSERMSSYTRQRYWRLLRGVYATAVKDGLLTSNPVLDVAEELRPTISTRDRQSQILEPQLFEQLQRPKVIESIIQVKTDADWWHPRDRAMLALLVDTGVTTAELIALCGDDLRLSNRKPLLLDAAEGAAEREISLQLHVRDSEEGVGRVLPISCTYTVLLMTWLRHRHNLLVERARRSCHDVEPQVMLLAELMDHGPLFMSRRARAADSELPPLEPVTVYYGVSQALKRLRQNMQTTKNESTPGLVSDAPYVAKGAGVIRNSVLRYWLDTLGVAEAIKRAGLKDERSLRLSVNNKAALN